MLTGSDILLRSWLALQLDDFFHDLYTTSVQYIKNAVFIFNHDHEEAEGWYSSAI